jgi:hypothetical protein
VGRLDDLESAAQVHPPARAVGYVILVLMFLTVLYAIRIAVENWSYIGV